MKYQELLKFVADYGHGVFALTMLHKQPERDALKQWIYRHPEYISEQKGSRGDIKLCALTKAGMDLFAAEDTLTRSSNWSSFADMALLNAYMLEQNTGIKYQNKPHMQLQINDKNIGLISPNWGLTKNPMSVNTLLSMPKIKRELLCNIELMTQIAKREGVKFEELEAQIKSAIVPNCFKFTRN